MTITKNAEESIAIVGGGITGLFCAYMLTMQHKKVHLFEASKRWGGRIQTIRLDKDNREMDIQDGDFSELRMYAEFGPMRVELKTQVLLKCLLTQLGIVDDPCEDEARKHACLIPFPSYGSPGSARDPDYDLRPDEIGKTPMQLLSLALLRIMLHIEVEEVKKVAAPENIPIEDFLTAQTKLRNNITLAAATQQEVLPVFTHWLETNLEHAHYDLIQTNGRIGHVALYKLGFWNLLSDYLSHDAIAKMRDLGNFYHLLPENPNAAEWLVWWLKGFAIGNNLQGIFGGMYCIIEKLMDKSQEVAGKDGNSLSMHTGCQVVRLKRTMGKGRLELVFDERKNPHDAEIQNQKYDRVILALPKTALARIVDEDRLPFAAESEILSFVDGSMPFPLVKVFVAVRNRWWGKENMANRFATRIPTREVHYWPARKGGSQGLIMLYTDRPASSFWSNYVPAGPQEDFRGRRLADELPEHMFKNDLLEKRLLSKITQYINENNAPDLSVDDIVWYGIRDWGREPYGGAAHVWRPQCRYWIIMARLGEIGLDGDGDAHIHICGEAYSDYHGFIEGSLRSAVYTLHRILNKRTITSILDEAGLTDAASSADHIKYIAALNGWVEWLDDARASQQAL